MLQVNCFTSLTAISYIELLQEFDLLAVQIDDHISDFQDDYIETQPLYYKSLFSQKHTLPM